MEATNTLGFGRAIKFYGEKLKNKCEGVNVVNDDTLDLVVDKVDSSNSSSKGNASSEELISHKVRGEFVMGEWTRLWVGILS